MEPMADANTMERMLINQASAAGQPITGSMELLPLCNMNCDMCFVRLSAQEMEARGSLGRADEWLELGRQMQRAGVLFLLLTGGEPLLHPDFKEIYLGLRRMGMVLTINTNGTLVDEEWADFFAANKPRRINVTLYGKDRETYGKLCHFPEGYDRAMRGIHLLRDRGLDVKISCSLTETNHQDWREITELQEKLQVPVRVDPLMFAVTRERPGAFNHLVRMTPEKAACRRVDVTEAEMDPETFHRWLLDTVYQADHTPEGANESAAPHCLAGSCSFAINWQREMRPCVLMTEPSIPVLSVGFEEAWHQIHDWVEHLAMSSSCSRCRLRQVCQTCMACAVSESGRYDGVPEYMCRYTKATVQRARELLKEKEGHDVEEVL